MGFSGGGLDGSETDVIWHFSYAIDFLEGCFFIRFLTIMSERFDIWLTISPRDDKDILILIDIG